LKPGRNDPCPCGSGKKYKKCCLPRVREAAIAARRRRDAEGLGHNDLVAFLGQERFRQDRQKAMDLWCASYGAAEPSGTEADVVRFSDWLIHDYRFRNHRKTLLEMYLEEESGRLSETELKVLEEWRRASLGIYEVTEVREGDGIGLRDIFTGKEGFAPDAALSESAARWDLILTRAAHLAEGIKLVGGAALRFPRSAKEELVNFAEEMLAEYRNWNPGSSREEFMKSWGYMFNHFAARWEEREKSHPVLTPEGEEVVPSRAVYRVLDRGRALKVLGEARGIHRVEAGYDGSGDPLEAHYRWLSERGEEELRERVQREGYVIWPSFEGEIGKAPFRFLGDIHFTRDRLTFECISRERLEKGTALLGEMLGDSVEHMANEFQDIDHTPPEAREFEAKLEGLMDQDGRDPEIEQVMGDFLEAYYEAWVDTPLPSLDNMTPMEAWRTPGCRAKVEELLKTIENVEDRRKKEIGIRYPVESIRRELEERTKGRRSSPQTSGNRGDTGQVQDASGRRAR